MIEGVKSERPQREDRNAIPANFPVMPRILSKVAFGRIGNVKTEKIILYYVFTPIADPEAVRLWQRTLCETLDLKGRILISKDGINGTLGGEMNAVKTYVRQTKQYPGFKKIDFKWAEGTGEDFPRLRIRVRDELVAFGAPGEIKVDEHGVIGRGVHLKPKQLHALVEERGDDVVFFDGRNAYEAAIGRFKDAVVPDVKTTREFVGEINSGKFDHLKDKAVVTYCTGGIRCEVLSSLMKRRGFNEVYQLDGGIVRYGAEYGDKGLWKGSLYVFDERINIEFSDETEIMGRCERCDAPTSRYSNCLNLDCRELILLCPDCADFSLNRDCLPTHAGYETR